MWSQFGHREKAGAGTREPHDVKIGSRLRWFHGESAVECVSEEDGV